MPSENFQEWTSSQQQLIAWLAVPSKLRKPRTHRAFAKTVGVTERTVSTWKHLPGLIEAAADLAKKNVMGEMPDIYGALIEHAKAGSFNHIKLCMEAMGHHVDRREHDVNLNYRDYTTGGELEDLFAEIDQYRAANALDEEDGEVDSKISVDTA